MKSPPKSVLGGCLFLVGGIFGWAGGSRWDDGTTISFLSVGQGDCTVFASKGHAILIDDGPATPFENAGEKIVNPWLDAHGCGNVDAILLSHPDEDHVGGTPAILARFPASRVVISDQFEKDPEMLGKLKGWNIDPATIDWIPKFSEMEIGEAHLSIECPDRPAGSDANDGSMFVKISVGNGSVVTSGDASKAVERSVERDENWRSEIVHVGHHGSHTACDQSWLETVAPQYAIISVGRNNRYGHPSQETVDRLERDRIKVYRTDRDGTITFRFDGSAFTPQSPSY